MYIVCGPNNIITKVNRTISSSDIRGSFQIAEQMECRPPTAYG
jgi:hypothetical protein